VGTRVSDKTPPAEYQGKHYRVRTAEASALLVEEWHGTDERENNSSWRYVVLSSLKWGSKYLHVCTGKNNRVDCEFGALELALA
jgi:hypothetical protein